MKRQAKVLAVLFLMLVVLVGQSSAQEMGRWIVHTTGDSAVNEAARQGVEARAGLTLKELPTRTGLVVLIPEVALEHMIKIPGVIAIEPDVVLTAVAEVLPWGVDRIDADLAWGTITGTGVDIAIIDTGIDKDHPDLAVAGGINFVRKGRRVDPDKWDDDNGHGTHCAGIAAALDNDIGVIGVAPGASLIAVKVLDRSGSGYLSDIVDGIYWAADNADVINLSLGIDKETLDQYPNDRDALQAAVDYADEAGVVVVAAAGNEYPGEDTVIYPARFDSAIAVSATDSYDNMAGFSSTGPSVELAAPGVGIYSTYKDGGYATGDGTSMAAPHVAGTAALVIAAAKSVSQLQTTAEDLGAVGWDPYYGYGLVDAAAAAAVSEGPTNDPPAVSITSPVDGDTFVSGAEILFEGTASDTEDDDATLTAALAWTSSIDGPIGSSTGGSISTTLSDGNHTITATVTDSGGKTASESISITVGTPPSGDVEVASIVFSCKVAGRNKFLYTTVTVVDGDNYPLDGVRVEMTLTHVDSEDSWNFAGDTGTDGTVKFTLGKAPIGYYYAEVTTPTDGNTTADCILYGDGAITQ